MPAWTTRAADEWVRRFAWLLPVQVGWIGGDEKTGKPHYVWWKTYYTRGPAYRREFTVRPAPEGFVNAVFDCAGLSC